MDPAFFYLSLHKLNYANLRRWVNLEVTVSCCLNIGWRKDRFFVPTIKLIFTTLNYVCSSCLAIFSKRRASFIMDYVIYLIPVESVGVVVYVDHVHLSHHVTGSSAHNLKLRLFLHFCSILSKVYLLCIFDKIWSWLEDGIGNGKL